MVSVGWSILPYAPLAPSVALEGLHLFDEEVRQTFSDSMCIDPSDLAESEQR